MMETLEGLLTPAVAVATIVILILQYGLGRRQWLLGLYEKRHPVFVGTMKYVAGIVKEGRATEEQLSEFLVEARDHWLLFGEEVVRHLHQLYNKGVELKTARDVAEVLEGRMKGSPQRAEAVKKQGELLKWFVGQLEETRKVFGRYLAVGKKGRARRWVQGGGLQEVWDE